MRLPVVLGRRVARVLAVGSMVVPSDVLLRGINVVAMNCIRIARRGLDRYWDANRCAGHGHRHRALDGEQCGKENQQPNA